MFGFTRQVLRETAAKKTLNSIEERILKKIYNVTRQVTLQMVATFAPLRSWKTTWYFYQTIHHKQRKTTLATIVRFGRHAIPKIAPAFKYPEYNVGNTAVENNDAEDNHNENNDDVMLDTADNEITIMGMTMLKIMVAEIMMMGIVMLHIMVLQTTGIKIMTVCALMINTIPLKMMMA